MSSKQVHQQRQNFLKSNWVTYPAFPHDFASTEAGRFWQIKEKIEKQFVDQSKDQSNDQIRISLIPAKTEIKLSFSDLSDYLKDQDWVVFRKINPQHFEVFLLAPCLADPLILKSNSEIQKKWSQFLKNVQDFFEQKQFHSIRTPTLVTCPGTEPFLDLFSVELIKNGKKEKRFLPTSPEIHLKKALSAGYQNIFEIKNCFRNNEVSLKHRPEFMMLEWYRSFADLEVIKKDCENLLRFLGADFEKIQTQSMSDLFKKYLNYELTPQSPFQELKSLALAHGLAVEDYQLWDDLFYLLFVEKIEPFLETQQPLFVEKYPPSQAAFSRLTKDGWGDRFELYWKGFELANAFHELNDPFIQQQRFQEDLELKKKLGKEIPPLDPEFMQALQSGMPPASGIALGLERLFMAIHGIEDIHELQLFNP